MEKITRRTFIKSASVFGASAILGMAGIGCSKKRKLADTLYVYNWANYVSKDTIPNFEKEFGVKVVYDNFPNNEELLAKLQTGTFGYDVIFPSDYMVGIMIKKGLLEELDMKNIPNYKNIGERFKNTPFDPENKYSIPYLWGTTGIGYNTDKITENVDSWNILWNEKYKEKISMLDDMRSIANVPLKILGHSVNTTDPKIIKQAEEMLLKQKPLVRAYTSDTYIDFLVSGDIWLAHGYSGDTFQAMKENKNIKYSIPKEGSDMWMDNMCIPKGAKNKLTAEVFINYLLRPEVGAEISNFTWYANPNEASHKFIKPEIVNNQSIYPPDEVLNRCEFQKDLGPATKYYEQLYNKVKS
ncbi:TPA: spermidine/putrescine ABC transporter substrate-binding protein [bacterium]|nr:spermidine/putrescine ABC transporter substrate-binding protein [bacterium]